MKYLTSLVPACILWLAPGLRGQTIEITSVPPYGALGSLQGLVTGVDPATHHVATFIHVEGGGFWTKPAAVSPTVLINPDGTFSANVVTGGNDALATIFAVAVLPSSVTPPTTFGGPRIPPSPSYLALDTLERYGPTLEFAGRTWAIKESPSPAGPGSNHFSSDPADVWVDAGGRLHLTVRFHDNEWWATEVILLGPHHGHGTYSFTTETEIEDLDANATFAGFLWDAYGDDTSIPGSLHREIDCEDSRWNEPTEPTTSQFVVQPYAVVGNLMRYTVSELSSAPTLTRFIRWEPTRIRFVAALGAKPLHAVQPADIVEDWTYAHDPGINHRVPATGRERFRLNLWLNDALPHAPHAGQEVEVVVSDFIFDCAPFCVGTMYCTAGISASGCQASISASGTASSTSPSGFSLIASAVEGSKDGLFFFGTSGRQANPWGNGTSYQCVVPPVKRGGLRMGTGTGGQCDGSFTQDLNARWCPTCPRPLHNPGAGTVVRAQLWYRDPFSSSNRTTSLSDAIEFYVYP